MKNVKTCCFTGPRPKKLFGYDHDAYLPLFDKLVAQIQTLVDNGYTRFITGGAQGVDQLAFWAVCKIKRQNPGKKIENVVYLPHNSYGHRWQQAGTFGYGEFTLMLQKADDIHVVCPDVDPNSRNAIQALFVRNHAMIDDSDTVIGVYHGDWTKVTRGSGTAECLQYAKGRKHEIITIDPLT